MGFKSYIKQGVGLLGKVGMGYADSLTGGLASKVVHSGVKFLDKNAGVIGKVARTLGKNYLSDETRGKIQNYAQQAIKYMPDGSIKTALNKISQAAQGKKVKEGAKLKTPDQIKWAIKHPEEYKAQQAQIAAKKEARKAKKTDSASVKPVIKPAATSKSTTSEGISQSAPKSTPKKSIFSTSKYADNGGEVFV